jgi:nitrous oxidase accessory protein NosD
MRLVIRTVALATAVLALVAVAASACTTTVSTPTAITNASVEARTGDTVCIATGRYASILIGGPHAGTIFMEPASGASVSIEHLEISPTATNFDLSGFTITSLLEFNDNGAEDVRVSDMDINRVVIHSGVADVVLERNVFRGDDGHAVAVAGEGTTESTEVRRIQIHRNLFDSPYTDGVYSAYHEDLEITQNEFVGLHEIGNHSDVYQSTWGGSGLVFSQNYVHDLDGQGVFIKDGTVTDAEITDNLLVRDSAGSPIALVDVDGALIARNTVWGNGEGVTLLGQSLADLTVTGNVFEYFTPLDEDEVPDGDASNTWWDTSRRQQIAARIAEDCNVLGGGWSWSQSGRYGANDEIYTPDDGDRVAEPGERQYWANANFPRPSLMGGDDWRVETELCDDGVGVTWKPGDWPVGRP